MSDQHRDPTLATDHTDPVGEDYRGAHARGEDPAATEQAAAATHGRLDADPTVSVRDAAGKEDVLRGDPGQFGGNPVGPAAPTVVEAGATEGDVAITGKTALIVKRLLRNKGAVIGLVMLAIALLFSLLGNLPNKWSYTDQDFMNIGSGPSAEHWFGTDVGGVDLYALIVRGTGKSLMIASVVGVVAPIIAAIYGTAIAFWGGWREKAGMWLLDMLILMPYFLLIAVFMGQFGGNALILALLLTAFGWMGMARVIRATTQSLREREYVQAARYMGVSDLGIIRKHIIPNIGSYLILQIVLGTFGAIIYETALSFLGVGVRAPDVSLGMLIGQSANQLSGYPWLFWIPTLALQWITVSLALIGDGMRDALDPNSKSGGTA
ncbi:ABC transporter permease [Arsenicicoccus dermatophilus]|uniref:ABC transporter permease n=1 Tax=Arsenicicoccus dermatophilus TaxID=1076331 RepID=UPI003916D9B0